MHTVDIGEVQDTIEKIAANISMDMITENLLYKRQRITYQIAIGA